MGSGIGKFRGWAALMMLTALPLFAAGPQRIAVVDLERVFREYYRSTIAEEAIKRQAEVYRAYLAELNSQMQELRRAAQLAKVNSQNLALSEEERSKYAREAENLARDAREKEAEIELYARERGQAMRELEEKKRAEIMAEILKEVENRAVAEGYDYVLDSSGRTMNGQPSVLRFPRGDDLTGAVIKKLNSTRTPGAAAPPESVNPKP